MLFTFPSRYSFTIGLTGVFSLAGWSRRIHTGFLVPRATQDTDALKETSCTEPSSSAARLSRRFHSLPVMGKTRSYYPGDALKHKPRFGLFPGRSPLLGESLLFSLPGGTKMFQFPPFASAPSMVRMTVLQTAGLSHSDTRGSKVICTSPRIFAAYRVLHRLREPRHPPCALSYFLRRPLFNAPPRGERTLILSAVLSKKTFV